MTRFFIHKFPAVAVFALLIILLGVQSYNSLPRESSPEVRVPLIFVNTVYPGVSAKDMETLVTKEIEGLLEGVEGAKKTTSTSGQGVSAIEVEFNPNVEVETALRRVRERVDIAKQDLPEDANEPYVQELNFSRQPFLIVSVSNPAGLEVLTPTIDFLEEEIKRIPGVLDVNISGKLEKEMAIEVDPTKLNHYDLSIDDVIQTIRSENVTIPGGILKNASLNYSLSVSGEIKDPEMFNQLVISVRGKQVPISEIGIARFQYKERSTYNRINGKPAVSLSITKRSGENLIRIAEDVKKHIQEHENRYPAQTSVDYTFDESDSIRDMVLDLENNIASGLILVLLVTFLFLGFTNSLFVSLAIPFSMLISFVVIQMLGITLNMVVLFSLILALGMLVDNGIVIVENIFRHGTMGKSKMQAAIDGSSEVAWPIITSTITTILAFFPIIFMPGFMGEFLSYIPKTVIIVLASSLFVALTINPAFCSRFLSLNEKQKKQALEGGSFFSKLKERYLAVLTWSLARPIRILILSVLMVFSGFVAYGLAGKEPIFFPTIDPPAVLISATLPHGTPLEKTDAIVQELEAISSSVPGSIDHIQGTSGQSTAEGFSGSKTESHYANLRIGFVPYVERTISGQETFEALREKVASVPGGEFKVKKQSNGPPQGHPISYEIVGDDYAILGEFADSILNILQPYASQLEDIDTDFERAKPQIKIQIDREKAGRYGLTTANIASTIRHAMNGGEISKFRQGKDEYDVILRFQKPFRNNIDALNTLEIVHEGNRIPLSSVADISYETDVSTIKRKNRKRTVEVWADFKEGIQGKEDIKKEIQTKVKSIPVQEGYYIDKGEGEQVQEEAQVFLMQAFMAALFLIFIVLIVQFNSITQPLIVLAAVFLSLGGVFWGFVLSGQTFVVIMSGVGIISLAGVVVNNGIVLIDFTNQLRREGKELQEAIVEAAVTRFRPVLLTAITTVLGLIPMAFGWSFDVHSFSIQGGSESSEWWKSLAWAVIFGLTFATVLTLVVVPTLLLLDQRLKDFWSRTFSKKG
jgi:multidrug efflux pump subunit AcrB